MSSHPDSFRADQPAHDSPRQIAHRRRAQVQSLLLLVIDAQTLFWETLSGAREPLQRRFAHLLTLPELLGFPTILTLEQPVERKGGLPESLQRRVPSGSAVFVKDAYDCLRDEAIRTAIADSGRHQIAVAGAETDVCVLQSVLGLCEAGYDVFVIADCVFSSAADPQLALRRMECAGAMLLTLKSLAYELSETVSQTPWLPEYQGRSPGRSPGQSPGLPEDFADPETW